MGRGLYADILPCSIISRSWTGNTCIRASDKPSIANIYLENASRALMIVLPITRLDCAVHVPATNRLHLDPDSRLLIVTCSEARTQNFSSRSPSIRGVVPKQKHVQTFFTANPCQCYYPNLVHCGACSSVAQLQRLCIFILDTG